MKNGISSIILQDYPKANRIFSALNSDYPLLPLGKIYLAAVQIAESYDYGEEYNEHYIDSLLNAAKDQSIELLNENKEDIWNKYFLGMSEGYLAYFNALNNDWLHAISEGLNAINDFGDIIKNDGDFYDAYIAIGTFKYWKSRKTEFFSWLPGYTDEKEEGIKMLKNAAGHSTYNKYLAISSLVWINIDELHYKQAAIIAESALKEYPGSRFFMWGLARTYEETNPEKSIEIYDKILKSLPESINKYDQIVLKHLMAKEYKKIGNKQKALALCDEILSIKIQDKNIYSRLKNRLERVENLKRELSR